MANVVACSKHFQACLKICLKYLSMHKDYKMKRYMLYIFFTIFLGLNVLGCKSLSTSFDWAINLMISMMSQTFYWCLGQAFLLEIKDFISQVSIFFAQKDDEIDTVIKTVTL